MLIIVFSVENDC